ncbi:MAG: pyruvate:ferredoxin (flavodoxin) oxidoreductase [Saprospirales bacterium]|nr:pyruvate:ferredoxin (flavodoxin) oxidoreductase [Saprospirales bacterium]
MGKENRIATIDANEATAHVAYRVNEVCAIYPITPSSPMAEFCDEWAARGIPNIWGNIPDVVEMQHEGGAAGAVHGSLQAGSLTTTFTASQGLLLMIPNMYKIAGELTPAVFHVAARSIAAQALSIFGDHSDVMACRPTGFAMLASASVQMAHDFALIAQASTMRSRIPFIHFFDGFRTSHEVNKLSMLSDEEIKSMIPDELLWEHRRRALNPDHPFIRGTAQNPDTYFQARETVNSYYLKTPAIVEQMMDEFAKLTGRRYELFQYHGSPQAERVIVLMGSGADTAIETAQFLEKEQGEKVGVLQVNLYRPWSASHFLKALPKSVKSLAVLDRTKEPGSLGEPLYQDVVNTITEEGRQLKVIGGRYGLSSKEFTPAMAKAVFDELKKEQPKNHFTVGINDDVTHTSLDYDASFSIEPADETRAMFFGLGADGTVGANKNSIKIIGENTSLYAQGYFVYDSKKSGSQTVSHLRFGPRPIRRPYLIAEGQANFVACHQFNFIRKKDLLKYAAPGATFLLNSPYPADEVWDKLPRRIQEEIIEKQLKFYVIDATKVAIATGMGRRINTIMQTCFFALSGVLPKEEAIQQIKKAIEKTYSKKGKTVVELNFKAVDSTLDNLFEVKVPGKVSSKLEFPAIVPETAPEFVKEVTAAMMRGEGDMLPVSKLPDDGTYPSATTRWEKRDIATFIPVWEPDICIQCGNCSFVCPHSVIRAKFFHEDLLNGAPEGFKNAPVNARGFPETKYTLQIYGEDCTGCGLCVEVCPAKSLKESGKKAINLHLREDDMIEKTKKDVAFFEKLPHNDRTQVDAGSVRGAQFLEPLFEFSGACAGCGETPYVRLLTQLFGDRLMVANATGCSSIYGGNQPTTPWSVNKEGRGPAWSNSLFEDNAEFGMGMRVAADKQLAIATRLLKELAPQLGDTLVNEILEAPQRTEGELREQRIRVGVLKSKLLKLSNDKKTPDAVKKLVDDLLTVSDQLVRRSVWLIGGDGWAYDIGSSGLDHALASGRNINVLVLDTEVYSNTGGQMSKATPTAATAKFAYAGKRVGKKDLALQAISYGNVYVAQIAMGANPQQTLLALREAEAYPGPSLILAYSHCIAHGIDMQKGLQQQDLAVASGYWPLIRYNPALRQAGKNPFVLDSPRPRIKLKDYAYNEMRYKILTRTNPQEADRLMELAQELTDLRWKTYEEMAMLGAKDFAPVA